MIDDIVLFTTIFHLWGWHDPGMIYKALEVIWIFLAGGRAGGRAGIEGTLRGPRGPKNYEEIFLRECGCCGKVFSNGHTLKLHIDGAHLVTRKFLCHQPCARK